MEIIFKKSSARIKLPRHLKQNIFIIYSPRAVKTKPASSIKIDTELILLLPKIQKDSSHPYSEGTKLMRFAVSSTVCR